MCKTLNVIVGLWAIGFLVKLIKDGNSDMILKYADVALTLFGFCLLGGIFEFKKKIKKVVVNLFYLSIVFLSSSISLFILDTLMALPEIKDFIANTFITIFVSIFTIVGIFGFMVGIFLLLNLLLSYSKEMLKISKNEGKQNDKTKIKRKTKKAKN